MNTPLRFRLVGFGLAILLLALLLSWAAHTTWQRASQMNERFSRVPIESFRSADQFRATLQEIDNLLLRYDAQQHPADWERVSQDLKQLDLWIDEQKPTLTTAEERAIWDKINDAYDDYQAAARELDLNIRRAATSSAPRRGFEHVESESKRLLTLAYELTDAHRQSLKLFLVQFQQSVQVLRRLTLGALSALLLLGVWLGQVVYRDMITPLQRKLVESHAIIERQEKLASLGVLAAGVAHEIRNPLTAIKARLFSQQKRLPAGSLEAADAAVINQEINRLERIVREVLQFARPAEPKLSVLRAGEPLREVRELMARPLEKQDVQLQLGPLCGDWIQVDPQQLKQVLINLVQNAAESIGARGHITLSARTTTQRLAGRTRAVVILEVTDTGRGIPAEVQKRLFDPFFSTKESGTGLGLAIAARIVEKHGGALEFQTQLHHGTTFGIVLPQFTPP